MNPPVDGRFKRARSGAKHSSAYGHILNSVGDFRIAFGGPKRNRLFMAASTSLYAL
jgi:hypothetical protein